MMLELWASLIVLVALVLAVLIAVYSWRGMRPLAVGVLLWFGVSLVLSQRGFFRSAAGFSEGDFVGFTIFGTLMTFPMIAILIAWLRSARFRAFTDTIPLPLLTGIQIYRVAGLIFLWMMTASLVPPEMGWITGIADLSVGLIALPLALALHRKVPGSRGVAIVWNVFGTADFVIAVSMVSLSITGMIALQPDPVMIGLHPLALIALFQLPISICLHGLSLRRLLRREQHPQIAAAPIAS